MLLFVHIRFHNKTELYTFSYIVRIPFCTCVLFVHFLFGPLGPGDGVLLATQQREAAQLEPRLSIYFVSFYKIVVFSCLCYVYTCMCVYMCISMCTYIYIYIYTYTYRYVQLYLYTQLYLYAAELEPRLSFVFFCLWLLLLKLYLVFVSCYVHMFRLCVLSSILFVLYVLQLILFVYHRLRFVRPAPRIEAAAARRRGQQGAGGTNRREDPSYEEFTRLAKTRLAQNSLNYLKTTQSLH